MSNLSFKGVCAFALFAIIPGVCLATAGPVPGRWERVEQLSHETEILVTLRWGEQQQGAYLGATPESLKIRGQDLQEIQFLKKDIDRVEQEARQGRAVRGARNGLIIGFVAGALIGGAAAGFDPLGGGQGRTTGPDRFRGIAIGGAVGGGIGAACGGLIGSMNRKRPLLYVADSGNP